MSVADAKFFNKHVKHLKANVELEKYLRVSDIPFSFCAYALSSKTLDVTGLLPDAMSAKDWFRFHGKYSNGENIVSK